MLVLGIIAAGGEYRHRTIIPAMLITPRRGALVAAKAIAIAIAGVVLSGLTFGLGLAAAVAELHAHGVHHLPPGTTGMFAGSVAAAVLSGLIGVALGYITRSTVAAVVGAVGWVVFAEYAILHTVAPQLFNWLISGTATVLTNPPDARQHRPHPPDRRRRPRRLHRGAARHRHLARAAARRGLTRPARQRRRPVPGAARPEEEHHAPDVQRALYRDRRR